MKTISIKQKSGFHCEAIGCTIMDKRGLFLQYIKQVNFNLPAGEYYIRAGIVSALAKPVVYAMPALPVAEKNLDLQKINITLTKDSVITPKSCIDVSTGDAYINPDWEKTLTTPQLVFCQNHEIGHFFYYTQEKCDQWAEYNMLDIGFNPVQISMASHTTLCGECKPGMESLLPVPPESALRRINTEDRMYQISKIAAMANQLQGYDN